MYAEGSKMNHLIITQQLNVKTHLKPIETAQCFGLFVFFFKKTGKMVSHGNEYV